MESEMSSHVYICFPHLYNMVSNAPYPLGDDCVWYLMHM